MLYIYQADTWCRDCGNKIRAERSNPPPEHWDEHTYDSDDYPKGPFPPEATDAPEHCAAGPDCLERVDLADWHGQCCDLPAPMRYVGAILNDALTEDGVDYARELMADPEPTARQVAIFRLWKSEFPELARCCTRAEPCAECG